MEEIGGESESSSTTPLLVTPEGPSTMSSSTSRRGTRLAGLAPPSPAGHRVLKVTLREVFWSAGDRPERSALEGHAQRSAAKAKAEASMSVVEEKID